MSTPFPPTAPFLHTAPLTSASVVVSVLKVSRSTPAPSDKPQPLDITLNLSNTTDQTLTDLTVRATRATPIENQSALDEAIAKAQPPDPSLSVELDTRTHKPLRTTLGPRANVTVVFPAATELPNESGVICLCRTAIYPLYFAAHVTDPRGSDVVVGTAQTYVPSFPTPATVRPVQVSWVWPILERPHRLTGDSTFVDDDLATEVSVGRLDRVLQVLTQVAGKVPITVLLDPELVDELAVMAAGKYQVETTGGGSEQGVGTDAAGAWLDRLRAALGQPGVQVSFTPFADPDVESLTRNGLSWAGNLGQDAQTRIGSALGGTLPSNDVAWPANETASQPTIDALARQGATSILLNDSTVPIQPSAGSGTAANGLTTLQSAAGPVSAVITAGAIERRVAPVVSLGGTGYAGLPLLVAEVAMRAVESQGASGFVPIVPPRLVNPSPDAAAAAILDTAHTVWSTGVAVTPAAATVKPADHAGLVPPGVDNPALSPQTIAVAQRVAEAVPALTTMLSAADADALVGPLPAAVQRTESNEWHSAGSAGDAFARRLDNRINALESGVRIVKPANGQYTLASSNSPLPITVENRLSVPVAVLVRVRSVNDVPGFTAGDLGRQVIAPNSKVTLHIPTKVERTGRFAVEADLLTPNGAQIGSVRLAVHSTALGTVGVIITAVAGGVLLLALLVRALRRLRRRGPATAGTPPTPRVPEPV